MQLYINSRNHLSVIYQSIGVQPLPDIDEVNMFKDDNSVVHFKRPAGKCHKLNGITFVLFVFDTLIFAYYLSIVSYSMRENLLSVVGQPETKQMQDMLPDILKQVGPQQYGFLKDIIDKTGKAAGAGGADDEDDVPPLVQGNFEQAAK